MNCKSHWIYVILPQITEIDFDLSFQAKCYKMWTNGKHLLIVFVISFKSEFFQFIFDIFERNITEIHASFKGNVAVRFACVGVVQCYFPFSVASAVTPSLQCATVCLTTGKSECMFCSDFPCRMFVLFVQKLNFERV